MSVHLFLVAGLLLVLQSVWAFIEGIRFLRLMRRSRTNLPGNYAPPAAVLIPCKGLTDGFAANADRFLAQDYPDYHLVFVVATREDAAYEQLDQRLRAHQASGPGRCRVSLIVAGLADRRGEKVNNLLRGLDAVVPGTEVLAFADIDVTPSAHWLRWLVSPLADPEVTIGTGFRWYLPGNSFASRLRAAWDTSIATMMRDHDQRIAWGGSMAIRLADFRSLRVAERHWANTVSDDYSLARAVHEAGGKIHFQPQCLVASREESSVAEFLRWSTRQIIITRVYAADLWRLGLASYVLYCGTLVWALTTLTLPPVIAYQRVAVLGILISVLVLGAAKGLIRSIVARELFPTELGGGAACYWQLSPLVPWVMLANFVVAAFKRRIEWRGTEYKLVSREKVEVLRRSGR